LCWDEWRLVAALAHVLTSEGSRTCPQISADIRISLKKRGGPTYRIELVRQPVGKRYWIRRNGRHSTKVPEATASQIAERIRRWLVSKS